MAKNYEVSWARGELASDLRFDLKIPRAQTTLRAFLLRRKQLTS